MVVLNQQWKKKHQCNNKLWDNENQKNDTTNNLYIGI